MKPVFKWQRSVLAVLLLCCSSIVFSADAEFKTLEQIEHQQRLAPLDLKIQPAALKMVCGSQFGSLPGIIACHSNGSVERQGNS